MATIVPAILEQTIEGFKNKLALVTKLPEVERIQVDFADGKFVPNSTVSITDIDLLNLAYTWEAHLMVEEPVDFLDYQIAGFKVIIVHYEAFKSGAQIAQALEEIRRLGMRAGLAINPATNVNVLKDFFSAADMFLLLGVEPGFQGREFVPETVGRMAKLREFAPHAILEVDGGVKKENIGQLAKAGADLLVVGSALVGEGNIQENYDILAKELLN